MARVAYVDHSYHRQTCSTLFLPEMLTAHGHDVEIFWDDAWKGGDPVPWETVCDHDTVVMFQSYCPTNGRPFRVLHSNVVYVPMYDQFGLGERPVDLAHFWRPFAGSKILSFSTAVHTLAAGFGLVSHFARYYPEPSASANHGTSGLHGFFWTRRQSELDWGMVRVLLAATDFDTFHVHLVGDPGFPPVVPPPLEDRERLRITTSAWFPRRSDFEQIVRRANVYFAPRLAEGIGQSFLEAMGRGQCVVAADRPTMNEYIVHGVNGLLYDPWNPAPLDFSDVSRIGQRARDGSLVGRTAWRAIEQSLVDFILTPSAKLYGD